MYCCASHGPVPSSVTISRKQEASVLFMYNCVEEQRRREPYQHFTDAERAITGTWVLDEVRLSVRMGYRILEIHEVYEYSVTQ